MRKPRKPLPRPTKPIARYTPLPKPTKRIRPRKADPSKRAWAKHRDLDYQKWIRTLPCAITGCLYRQEIECAHVKTRGSGGDDRKNCLPLCVRHHRFQHDIGIKSFQEFYHIDMRAVALALDVQYTESR
jgi:hypothetical protein